MKQSARHLSRMLYWIFWISVPLGPAIVLITFLNLEWSLTNPVFGPSLGVEASRFLLGPVTWSMKLLGLLAAAVPTALTCAALWNLARLFQDYSLDKVFTPSNVRRIKRIGLLLLVREALAPARFAAMSLILSMNNPPGQHMLSLSFSSANVTAMVTALSIIVAAHVMDQARELKEESDFVI